MHMPDPLQIDPTQFDEAIRAAQLRIPVLPDEFYSSALATARHKAFTITGLTNIAQIEQIFDSLNDALSQGRLFGEWKKEVTGQDSPIKEFPRHRLENIYRNHVQQSYNAGRWISFREHKSERPYLMYDAVNDARTRPAHRALDGVIKPVDDQFWIGHSPQLGHGCRCRLISFSEKQALRRGGVTQNPDPNGQPDAEGWGLLPEFDVLTPEFNRRLRELAINPVPSFAEFKKIAKSRRLKVSLSESDYGRLIDLLPGKNPLSIAHAISIVKRESSALKITEAGAGIDVSATGGLSMRVTKNVDDTISLTDVAIDVKTTPNDWAELLLRAPIKTMQLLAEQQVAISTLGKAGALPVHWLEASGTIQRNASDLDLDTTELTPYLISGDPKAFWAIVDSDIAAALLAGISFETYFDTSDDEQMARLFAFGRFSEKFQEISDRVKQRINS